MTQRIFLDMPIFSAALRRLPRRRHAQPVLVCTRQITELQCVLSSDVTPLVVHASASPRLEDFGIVQARPVRRARKTSGDGFVVADLRECETLPMEDLVRSIRSEPDHPYFPLLGTQSENFSVVLPGNAPDPQSAEAAAWLGRLLSVDGQIFVPTVQPTLAVSLDQEHGQISVAIACAPALSPSIRLPTLHMPLSTKKAVLEGIARRLETELDLPPLQTSTLAETDNWILLTLADLYRYMIRKGSREWPADLSFDLLSWANGQVLRAELMSPPLDWLGQFLETQSSEFNSLGRYIDGLQRLIFARYEVLGEKLPPRPSDVFIDLKL